MTFEFSKTIEIGILSDWNWGDLKRGFQKREAALGALVALKSWS